MRALIIVAAAASVVSFAWQSPVEAQSKQPQARTLGYCLHIANSRGWTTRGEKGRWPFIKRCMRGDRI